MLDAYVRHKAFVNNLFVVADKNKYFYFRDGRFM